MNLLAALRPLVLFRLRFHLLHLLLGGAQLPACTLELLPGFPRLRATVSVLPGSVTQSIAILLLLLLEIADAVSHAVLILGLDLIAILRLNLISVPGRRRLLRRNWQAHCRDYQERCCPSDRGSSKCFENVHGFLRLAFHCLRLQKHSSAEKVAGTFRPI